MASKQPAFLLPLIVFSQFAGTSLWFAGNAIINDIQPASTGFANITSIVQFGFIAGTLIFSLLTIADRFSSSKVFFFSSLIAATANLVLIWLAKDIAMLITLRFITGFFLAGIYPVGMKIAADCFPHKLGNALGFLVGALVLGTAFPHLLKSQLHDLEWQNVLIATSTLAFIGGLMILLFIPQFKKHSANSIDIKASFSFFRSQNFRSAAFGYFGHMWELYALWAFVPAIILLYNEMNGTNINASLWSFIIIGAGSLGCVAGGIFSKKWGSKNIAFYSLLISGICCLLSPLIFHLPTTLFFIILFIWGVSVPADSPQFSTMVAQSANEKNKGTALTLVTCIGFAITIISIQVLKGSINFLKDYTFLVLFLGPAYGLFSLKRFRLR